jgi:hypothetical protein
MDKMDVFPDFSVDLLLVHVFEPQRKRYVLIYREWGNNAYVWKTVFD